MLSSFVMVNDLINIISLRRRLRSQKKEVIGIDNDSIYYLIVFESK